MNLRRLFFKGRMNKDLENRILEETEYRDAWNVNVLDSEGSGVGSIQNSFSNKLLTDYDFGFNPRTIGAYADEAEDKIYWFVVSDSGCFLMEWDNNDQQLYQVLADTRPTSTRVLNLDLEHLITGVEKIISEDTSEDLLAFTDDNIEPCCINIERCKTFPVNGFDKEDIYLIKKPPPGAPTTQLTYSGGLENFIEEEFLSFSYRFKYLDGEYSALSDYSNYNFTPGQFDLNFESVENMGMVNFFNAVWIGINTGDKRVTDIQVVLKKSNSNNLYIVETFNKEKEGYGDNQTVHFMFSNNKIYQLLPEKELYRQFDNVPLKAKALTLIGNRLVFGNYLEGRNIVDADSNPIRMDYSLDIISNDLSGQIIPYTLLNMSPQYARKIRFDFTGFALNEGTRISIFLDMISRHTPLLAPVYEGSFSDTFDYILDADYDSAADLAQSPAFILFVETIMTNVFLQGYEVTPPADSVIISETGFTIEYTTDTITLVKPTIVYQIDETPEDEEDEEFHIEQYEWLFMDTCTAFFREFGVSSSCKTNRSYEIGVLYRDEYKRATTVLTTLGNTIYIPQSLSEFQNKIKVTIENAAPEWAYDYKIVVKQQPLTYQTIYGVLFYEEGPYYWIRLDGANKDKVKEGDTLIVKSDYDGARNDVFKVRVIEISQKDEDFIESNVDGSSADIIELPGLYMKIRGNGVTMESGGQTFFSYHRESYSSQAMEINIGQSEGTLYGRLNETSGDYEDFPVTPGSRIRINLIKDPNSSLDRIEYDRTFIAQGAFDNIEDWYDAEFPGLGATYSAVFTITWVRDLFPGLPDNALYMQVDINAGSTLTRLKGTVSVQKTESLVIFETEPKQADNEIYYETQQAFRIQNGNHLGNLQNQNDSQPAIIELDFFNCYSMGNGAESYLIKDALNKNSLNIDLRPSATSIEGYKQVRRYADLTYSEPFVESSNLNGLNEFNLSTGNYKELDKQYSSIQKLHSRDTDIVVLQEEKASKVLFEKDALSNADGSVNVTSVPYVLGKQVTYLGENGIGTHPESFAKNDFQLFYSNAKRGVVQRLSLDGTTDIVTGMVSFFRNVFLRIGALRILGGFDPYFGRYIISPGYNPTEEDFTLEDKYPSERYPIQFIPTSIVGVFNKNVIKQTGTIRVYNADGDVLLGTFDETQIFAFANEFSIDMDDTVPGVGDYYILMDAGLFLSIDGELFEGISDSSVWTFGVKNGDYSSSDYSSDYLLTV